MIYLFTGNSDYLVREKTLNWKKLFIEKNGDFNLVHFKNLGDTDNNLLLENVLAEGFMGEKKLIIIDDFPLNSTNKNTKMLSKQDFLESIITQIPGNNIVIFSSSNPDRRSRFYKALKKNATKIEEFNTKGEHDISHIIQKKYGESIDYAGINLLIKYKSGDLEKCLQEIKKLLITRTSISAGDIKKYIKPELEESIFQVIDNILDLNHAGALEKIDNILHDTSIYAFYNNLLSNLRTSVYISKLRHLGNYPAQIISHLTLGNRSFLANKNYRITHSSLENLYISLVNLDKKMKSGKLLGTEESDFRFEIEKCIIAI